jgi:hypothetical protein
MHWLNHVKSPLSCRLFGGRQLFVTFSASQSNLIRLGSCPWASWQCSSRFHPAASRWIAAIAIPGGFPCAALFILTKLNPITHMAIPSCKSLLHVSQSVPNSTRSLSIDTFGNHRPCVSVLHGFDSNLIDIPYQGGLFCFLLPFTIVKFFVSCLNSCGLRLLWWLGWTSLFCLRPDWSIVGCSIDDLSLDHLMFDPILSIQFSSPHTDNDQFL